MRLYFLNANNCARVCAVTQALGTLGLHDLMLGPSEIVLGAKFAGGMGGQIFRGKFGLQQVERGLNGVM